LSGVYALSKEGKIAVGYLFRKLESSDYYYSAYQAGSTDTTVLPTNQRAPGYSVSVVSVSYIYSFQ
jgi:hypothetical protein